MRKRGIVACLVAICTSVVLSAPARADEYDFLSILDSNGVYYYSMVDMIDIGKELCHDLRSGVGPPVVLGKLSRTGFANAEAAIILVAAVNTMCGDAKPGVAAWARSIGYTGPV